KIQSNHRGHEGARRKAKSFPPQSSQRAQGNPGLARSCAKFERKARFRSTSWYRGTRRKPKARFQRGDAESRMHGILGHTTKGGGGELQFRLKLNVGRPHCDPAIP